MRLSANTGDEWQTIPKDVLRNTYQIWAVFLD